MFNNISVYRGDWKATKHMPPVGDGKWQLHNLATDPGQNHNVSIRHPDILQKLITGYDSYSTDVGIVDHMRQKFYNIMVNGLANKKYHYPLTLSKSLISSILFMSAPYILLI